MPSGILTEEVRGTPPRPAPRAWPFTRVFACIEDAAAPGDVAQAAADIASDSGAALRLATVLPGLEGGAVATDPVEWDMARRAAARDLADRAEGLSPVTDLSVAVLSGRPVPALSRAIAAAGADLVVLGSGRRRRSERPGLGGVAHALAAAVTGSVMIVPPGSAGLASEGGPVLAAVDCSPHAQAALAVAGHLAAARRAELVLVHALPEPADAIDGPPEPGDEALCERLRQRNASAARRRLERLRPASPDGSVRCRLRLVEGGDPREVLARAVAEENAGLLVIAARGSGRTPDLAIGSTADYLLSVCRVPVLMVRGRSAAPPVRDRLRMPGSRRPLGGVA
jgi:nucleotide-binding universal stress UspA family protein